MDSAIIAALIGAVGTIVAAIITVMVATRKQAPPAHGHSSPAESPQLAEYLSQNDRGMPVARTAPREAPSQETATESELGGSELVPIGGKNEELAFEEVIKAIRQHYPDAILGRTAEQGKYFDRAKRLTNYRLYRADPPGYGAAQANGKIMWLYLGKGGKICCGDKE